jgi:hypothetical protein
LCAGNVFGRYPFRILVILQAIVNKVFSSSFFFLEVEAVVVYSQWSQPVFKNLRPQISCSSSHFIRHYVIFEAETDMKSAKPLE